ncbi:hypothetical protein N7478_013144 [Penicillium angulare]|uniref:uncharacterized protein n=1 Tax=Penicillium angulare TaxID=116970 RepID=UPI00254094C2|nr:uncharacterized protein N7478_013144 [Penicillium angulare]KAJ5257040.1 hypothetical protein N7478_013144 [Penicillium angulare]
MLSFSSRYARWLPILAGAALIFIILDLQHLRKVGTGLFKAEPLEVIIEPDHNSIKPSNQTVQPDHKIPASASACRPLPGIEDVLVIVKTGITEALDKIPVHVRTTLRCIPNVLIVSDFEEEIDGIRTHDVFRNMSNSVRENKEFGLYNRARNHGRAGLTEQDFVKVANSAAGMGDNPGWALDKWKFLPMVVEARNYHPTAKWYFVLEADTYPFWSNLLVWLENFDSSKKWYLGNQMMISGDVFAHGGSGFALSNGAINAVADEYTKRMDAWHDRTMASWAGDCMLGIALLEIGISLTWSWPHVTGQSVWDQDAVNEAYGERPWCHAPVTFHHMTPTDIEMMYKFETEWFSDKNHSHLLYSDVFSRVVHPRLADRLDDWDNKAGTELIKEGDEEAKWTLSECAEACAQDTKCIQYSIDEAGTCKTSDLILRGVPSPGVTAGTMMWRVDSKVHSLGECENPEWVIPT